jgi:hypothetical protein
VRKESPALQVILVCLVLKDNQDLEGNPVLMAITGHQDLHILLPQNTRNLPMSHRVTVLAEDQDIRHKITDHSRKNQE